MDILDIIETPAEVLDKVGFSVDSINLLENPDVETLKQLNMTNIARYYKILKMIEKLKTAISLIQSSGNIIKSLKITDEPIQEVLQKYFLELELLYYKLNVVVEGYDFDITYSEDLTTVYIYNDVFRGLKAIRLRVGKTLKGNIFLKDLIDTKLLHYLVKYRNNSSILRLLEDTESKKDILNLVDRIANRLNKRGDN